MSKGTLEPDGAMDLLYKRQEEEAGNLTVRLFYWLQMRETEAGHFVPEPVSRFYYTLERLWAEGEEYADNPKVGWASVMLGFDRLSPESVEEWRRHVVMEEQECTSNGRAH